MQLRRTWPAVLSAAALVGLLRAWIVVEHEGFVDEAAWNLAWRSAAEPFLVGAAIAVPIAALLAVLWRVLADQPRLSLAVPASIVPLGLCVPFELFGTPSDELSRGAWVAALLVSCAVATLLSPTTPRRVVLACAALGLVAALAAVARFLPIHEQASWPDRPNVVLISVDTQRADHLSCYGYERPTSPEIDRFAERAVRFEHAFTPYPWTLLAHMSLFTSLNPSAHGVRSDRALAPGIPTLAEHLRDAGYLTAAVLDDVVWLERKYAFDRGFDVYLSLAGTADVKRERIEPLLDDLGDAPFFLFLHFFDVHSDVTDLPYDSREEYRRLFAGDYDGDFTGCSPEGVCASRYLKQLQSRGDVLEGADLDYLIALYDAGVRTFDRELGHLLDELEERGLMDTSVIVLTADHGEAFFEHGVPLHSGVHDEVVRVPLLVRTPDTRTARVVGDLVSLIDVAPTLLELCGIEPLGMQGESFREWIVAPERDAPRERRWVLFEDGQGGVLGLRDERWKLMRGQGKGWRLFDLENDPEEQVDVLSLPGDPPAVFEPMRAQALRELARHRSFRERFATESPTPERIGDRARLEALGYVDELDG